MSTFKKILRTVGMIALACTGIGALYMLSRMRFVSPRSVGIVSNYSTQEFEILEPGIHCILSPTSFFEEEISKQTQTLTLGTFSAKSLDNVDANVQADITFKINDPLKLYQSVKQPMKTFQEAVKGAFSSAIQTLNYPEITAAEINALAHQGGHVEPSYDLSLDPSTAKASIHSISSSARFEESKSEVASVNMMNEERKHKEKMSQHGAKFFTSLLTQMREWGIEIINFRIVTLAAKHQRVSEALELTAEADVRAKAQLKAANSQAETIRTLAAAEKDAEIIRAQGVLQASQTIAGNSAAMAIYAQDTQVRVAGQLGNSRNLFVNAPSFAASPLAALNQKQIAANQSEQSPAALRFQS
jgi:regulator of protease activity HflC (stomatin/prohibitin superfamily)